MEPPLNSAAPAEGRAIQERFALKAIPILIAIALGVGILVLSSVTVEIVKLFAKLPERPQMPWIAEFYEHFAMLAYTLLAIRFMRQRYPGDYGLVAPAGRSYIGIAIGWGLFFGAAMMLVDYGPQLLSHKPPADQPYPLTAINIAGWFSYQGLVAGPSEEVLLRGLLVTYLILSMPGRVSWRGYTMNGAGIVVAVLVAAPHLGAFFTQAFLSALGRVLYTFAFGVLSAYWLEKSRSLAASVVFHSVGALSEYALIFAVVAAWG
ncbi:MAG: CPBP family intramembrane glutamic endopeptidase [Rhizomicrobium sp.]